MSVFDEWMKRQGSEYAKPPLSGIFARDDVLAELMAQERMEMMRIAFEAGWVLRGLAEKDSRWAKLLASE